MKVFQLFILASFLFGVTRFANPQSDRFKATLFYPRLVSLSDFSEITRITPINLDKSNARFRFTAYDSGGALVSRSNIINPATRTVASGQHDNAE